MHNFMKMIFILAMTVFLCSCYQEETPTFMMIHTKNGTLFIQVKKVVECCNGVMVVDMTGEKFVVEKK